MHFFYVKLSMYCFMIFMTRLRSQYHETLHLFNLENKIKIKIVKIAIDDNKYVFLFIFNNFFKNNKTS